MDWFDSLFDMLPEEMIQKMLPPIVADPPRRVAYSFGEHIAVNNTADGYDYAMRQLHRGADINPNSIIGIVETIDEWFSLVTGIPVTSAENIELQAVDPQTQELMAMLKSGASVSELTERMNELFDDEEIDTDAFPRLAPTG